MSATTETAPKKVTIQEPEPAVHHDSQEEEYESAEEIDGDYDEEDVEEIEIEEEVEEEEEDEEGEEGEEEDEEEDPSQQDKPLDDDEDRKNPQFIPKKGYFYEHDDRTRIGDENEEEVVEEPPKEEKPKKPSESLNKWSHDKFDESEQAPKSREELTTLYGYDIRSEDQPPRARRRRRYGRGPTKYTRRWEEEEAYQKPRGGYRGRGRGGVSRGSTRRNDSREDEYEEEFPELPGGVQKAKSAATTTEKAKPVENQPTKTPAPPKSTEGNKEAQPQRRQESGRKFSNRESFDRNNDSRPPRRNNRDMGERDGDDNYRGGYGGRGQGGMNRRGRRNEYTNRNRYPNRRDDFGDVNNSNSSYSTRGGGGGGGRSTATYSSATANNDQDNLKGNSKIENNNRRGGDQRDFRSVVNGTSGGQRDVKHDRAQQQPQPHQQNNHQPQQHRIPPFSNTEYPAPSKANASSRGGHAGSNLNRQNDRRNNAYVPEHDDRETTSNAGHNSGPEPQKEPVRDLRDKLNAMRMQKNYQNPNQNDRRNQIPPRLQQQQQPTPPPVEASAKPRRYSTQRERVPQQPPIVTSGTMVISSTVAPPAMTQGVPPNIVPVVTMSDGVVPSTVAAYQPTNYYGETQVYEASGTTTTGNGPSVSPSMWNPHANAYATAPYPSPPTAPPVAPAPYADPTAFINPGAPIYAAPPQFLQDPSLMNYSGPAPPFPPPYHAHPQGYQGYAQVTPAPPPEVYHGGVTYYSTQNQIQRPPMIPVQKRPKSVLQLVEPPEKSKTEKGSSKEQDQGSELIGEAELSRKLEATSLEPRETRKPSPLREFTEETSWAAEMDQELTSPTTTSYPEGSHFGVSKEEEKLPEPESNGVKNETKTETKEADPVK